MSATPPQSIQVLHVDDDPSFTDLARTFLERESDQFAVETATSADEGLELLTDSPPDCVVSDYNMPGLDGIEFLEAVREQHPDLPFILYTGKGSEAVASEAIAADVTDYLQKGSRSEQYELLANRIQNSVQARRETQRADRQEELMRLTEFVGDTGGFEMDIATGEVLLTDGAERIMHPTEDADRTIETGLQRFHPEDREEIRRTIERAAETGEQQRGTWRYRPPESDQGVLEITFSTAAADGAATTVRGAVSDITDRRERQREVRRLQQAIDDADVPITLADPSQPDEPLVYVNDAFEEMTGYAPEETLGRNCRFLQGRDTDPDTVATLRDAIDNEERVTVELRNYRKDGTEFWNRVSLTPIYDTDGQLVRYLGTQGDVTERKDRERQLTELNQATEDLLRAETPTEVATIGVRAAREILDLQANAIHLSGDDDTQLVPVAQTEELVALLGDVYPVPVADSIAGRVYRRGEATVIEDVREDPHVHDPETDLRGHVYLPLADHGILIAGSEERAAFDHHDIALGELLAGNLVAALDRTERERELEQYERIVENLDDVATIIQPDGTITYVSPSVRRLLGYEPAELLGENGFAFQPPETSDAVGEAIERVLETPDERHTVQTRFRQADGSWCWIESTLRNRLDHPVIDGILVSSRDITQRRRQKVHLEERNERLDEFASVVSHDLRNPLRVADSRLELIREECASDHIDDLAQALDRMDTLIEDLLTLARQGDEVGEVEPVVLADLIEGCSQTIAGPETEITVGSDRSVRADGNRLQQLLENLLQNAVEHGGPDVTVTIGELDTGLYIEDDGPGIPDGNRADVFEAGYSTTAEGTGFGLRIVKQVTDAHGWEIAVSESEHGGARFELTGMEFVDP